MIKYIIRRILESIPTVIGVTIISFVLIHIVPGNPVRIMLGNHYTPLRAAELTKTLGLNKPVWEQYFIWLGNLLQGNFGFSYTYEKPVASLMLQALPHTIIIVVVAVLLAHVFAVFLGSVQAYFENSKFDQIATVINYFFYSMPSFWLAVLLVIFFSIDLPWLPSGGIVNTQLSNPGFGDWAKHLILPIATLFLVSVVRTARMKGSREFRVIFIHALRNSILPLITLFGLSLPALLSGALFVEEVFNYPGMGLLYWDAVNARDYPIIMGVTVFVGLVTVIGNLIADILYGLVDPRIQY